MARAQTAEQLVAEFGVAGLLELVPTGPPDRCLYSIEYSPAVDYSLDDAPRTYQGEYTWSEYEPNSLTCTASGVTFPDPAYPTIYKIYTSVSGAPVQLRYFVGPYPETADGVWLDGCMDYYKLYYTSRTVMNKLTYYFNSQHNVTIGEIAYLVYHEMARWTASYTYRYHNYGSVIVSPEECADDLGGSQPW